MLVEQVDFVAIPADSSGQEKMMSKIGQGGMKGLMRGMKGMLGGGFPGRFPGR